MPQYIERPGQGHVDQYLEKAKRLVVDAYNHGPSRDMYPPITEDQVFIVWFSKTLQNWKAMVSTTVPLDSSYFEVTYNGDKGETYVDWYFKHSNTVVPD